MRPSAPSENKQVRQIPGLRLFPTIILLVYMALIAYFSLQPGSVMPDSINDKVLHFLAYGGMTALAAWSCKSWRQFVFAVLGIIIFSACLEALQSLIPGRFMSGWDLVANSCGALVMSVVAVLLSRISLFETRLPAKIPDR